MINFNFILVIAFCAVVTAKDGAHLVKTFEQFRKRFGKKYKNQQEVDKRFMIFSKNMHNVSKINADNKGAVSGITQFSDLTQLEFREKYLTYRPQPWKINTKKIETIDLPIPEKIDWVAEGAVNSVRNQGAMNTGPIIARVQSIEGAAKASGKHPLIQLSVEQVVDCEEDHQDLTKIDDYILKNGMESQKYYKHGNPCGYEPSRIAVQVHSIEKIKVGEEYLKNATAFRPVMVCVDASSWQMYSSGILSKCNSVVNHCVELVGYDFSYNVPYWRLQNTWGTSWGESGYIRVAAGKDLCKIADYASYAVI